MGKFNFSMPIDYKSDEGIEVEKPLGISRLLNKLDINIKSNNVETINSWFNNNSNHPYLNIISPNSHLCLYFVEESPITYNQLPDLHLVGCNVFTTKLCPVNSYWKLEYSENIFNNKLGKIVVAAKPEETRSILKSPKLHNKGRLLSSYEENLFKLRMPYSTIKIVKGFGMKISINKLNQKRTKEKHCENTKYSFNFEAQYFNTTNDHSDGPLHTPYCTKIPISMIKDEEGCETINIPYKGRIQMELKLPDENIFKCFIINYNIKSLQPNQKAFIRQRIYLQCKRTGKRYFKFGIQINVVRNQKQSFFIRDHLIFVFSLRAWDSENFSLCTFNDVVY